MNAQAPYMGNSKNTVHQWMDVRKKSVPQFYTTGITYYGACMYLSCVGDGTRRKILLRMPGILTWNVARIP